MKTSHIWFGSLVESLQSHMILTMSHWSSGLTCLLPVTRDPGSNPHGGSTVSLKGWPMASISAVSHPPYSRNLLAAIVYINK